jgi:hypothetical protein
MNFRKKYKKYSLISFFLLLFPPISFAFLIEFSYKNNDYIKNLYCDYVNSSDYFCRNFIFENPGKTDQYNNIWFVIFIFCGITSFYYGSIAKSANSKIE